MRDMPLMNMEEAQHKQIAVTASSCNLCHTYEMLKLSIGTFELY